MKPRPTGSSKAPSAETRVHSITFRISAPPPDPAGQAPARIVTVTGGRPRRPRKQGGPGPPSLRPPRDLYRWEPYDVPIGEMCEVTADLLPARHHRFGSCRLGRPAPSPALTPRSVRSKRSLIFRTDRGSGHHRGGRRPDA